MNPSCSARLLQPFMRFVARYAAHRDLVPHDFWEVAPDARVSLAAAHSMLDGGVERTRDEQLGLKLGTTMSLGMGGVFDYAVRTAATFADSLTVAATYSRLLSDSFHVSYEEWQRRAVIRLDADGTWPKAAADFAMSAVYKLHVVEQLPAAGLECWFTSRAPGDPGAHQRIFAGATLRFGAPFNGFVFELERAHAPMTGADPALHALLRARADALLIEATRPAGIATLVRRKIAEEMAVAPPSAETVARSLHMSRRTFNRRLEAERTTFLAEVEAVRRKIALEAILDPGVPLTEIAFRAGFSHVESFHRAFKRWTNETPSAYRSRCMVRC